MLQVVQATYSSVAGISNTSYTDTGLTANITPSASNSKVLVLISQSFYMYRNTVDVGHAVRIVRDGNIIFSPAGSGEYGSGYFYNVGSTVINLAGVVSYTYLDSPNTTSSTTYKTQGRAYSTSNSGGVSYQDSGATSTITLLEIGA